MTRYIVGKEDKSDSSPRTNETHCDSHNIMTASPEQPPAPLHQLLRALEEDLLHAQQSAEGESAESIKRIAMLAKQIRRMFEDRVEVCIRPDHNDENMEDSEHMEANQLAIVRAVVGYVEQTVGQPPRIRLTPPKDWYPDLEQTADELNAALRDQIPIIGDRRNLKAIQQGDASSLNALSDVIAVRTLERVQLTVLPRLTDLLSASR